MIKWSLSLFCWDIAIFSRRYFFLSKLKLNTLTSVTYSDKKIYLYHKMMFLFLSRRHLYHLKENIYIFLRRPLHLFQKRISPSSSSSSSWKNEISSEENIFIFFKTIEISSWRRAHLHFLEDFFYLSENIYLYLLKEKNSSSSEDISIQKLIRTNSSS